MRPQLTFSLAACLAFSGCLHRSPTWETVISTRVDTRDSGDPSATYAEHMSGVLKSSGVQHKIVTYEFRYRTRLREDAMDTRTAVLYRDEAGGRNPWWLVDNVSRTPVWLPGENVEKQLEFYLHRPATVLTVNGISASSDGKSLLGEAKSVTAKVKTKPKPEAKEEASFFARLLPVGKTERSRKFAVNGKAVPAQSAPAPRKAKMPERTKVAAVQSKRDGKKKAAASKLAKTKPSKLVKVKSSKVTSKQLALFRARHGTKFDPSSMTDRVKMERLLRGARNVARL